MSWCASMTAGSCTSVPGKPSIRNRASSGRAASSAANGPSSASREPAGVSMSAQSILDRASGPLEQSVAAGRIPGGILGVVEANGDRATRVIGEAQRVPFSRPMTEGTWFDLASLTKVIFTTPRILALAEAGTIDLDAPLTSVIPDFRQYNPDGAWERKLTFRQCLGHQTPLPAVFPLYTYGDDPDRLRGFVLQREWAPGPPPL